MRYALTLAAILSVTSAIAQSLSNDQIRDMLRQVAAKDMENDKKQRDYTYTEREVENHLDGKGRISSTESKTFDVMELYGEQVRRLVAKDGHPLSGDDARKEEEKIQKRVDKRKNESENDRAKRREREEKDREKDRKFVSEVADAYDFRLVGIESPAGRETYVIDAEPRPGFHAQLAEAKILPKFRFRAWIDKQELEWKKLDIQCIDTVSFGLFIARLHKDSRILIEQTRVNDEVWLPQHISAKVDARIALVKGFNIQADVTFSDYKKFSADTKLLQ